MLTFDPATDRFILDGVAIGRGTCEQDVDGRLPGRFSDVPGQRGYRNFDGRSGDLNVALGFRNGLLESGWFVVALPGQAAWERLEENEAWRRAQHEAIMQSLFGAMRHETRDLIVDLVRDPRHRTGQLRFVVPIVPDPARGGRVTMPEVRMKRHWWKWWAKSTVPTDGSDVHPSASTRQD